MIPNPKFDMCPSWYDYIQGWTLPIILMAIKINQKIRWGPSDEKRRKKMQLLAWYTTKDEKKLIPSRAHKKTRKSHILGTYEKKCDFHLPKVFLVTFSEGNGRV